MIPLLRCTSMQKAIAFYTRILDFRMRDSDATADDLVVLLENEGSELMLTSLEGDQKMGIAVNVIINDVDARFSKYIGRGLDQSHRIESPVHLGPTNQTWGTREFYVTDHDGNTLRFVQRPQW